MRVIFFGALCAFSTAPLQLLLEAGHDLCAVMLSSGQSIGSRPITPLSPPQLTPIPIVDTAASPSIVSIAWRHQIPIYHINRLSAAETVDTLARLQAEAACVACFPKRIPSALLGVPRWGFLNVHPSLLPRYRGPYPLFWMLRHGDRRFGVTIHFMDKQWDSGDIAAQAEVDLPDGFSSAEADRALSQQGAELLVDVLRRLEKDHLTRRAQPAGGAYFPAPQESDFVIDTAWPAQRAFNFMRGTDNWQRSYPIEAAGQRFRLKQALFYSSNEILDQPFRLLGEQIDIQFSPGVLRAISA